MRAKRTRTAVAWIYALVVIAIVSLIVPEETVRKPLFIAGVVASFGVFAMITGYIGWRVTRSREYRIRRYLLTGDLQRALPQLRVMVDHCEWISGPKHEFTTHWRHLLAETQYGLGHVSDALNTANLNLVYRTEMLGPDHRDTMASRLLRDKVGSGFDAAG